METKESLILFLHAIIIYFVCFAVMGASMATLPIDSALIVHAAAAPFVSAIFSYIYYKKFNYSSPLITATVIMVTVILLDFFLTATIILQDYAMFYSLIGTWIPFALIFTGALIVGIYLNREQ
jgi:multidrug transporter EmrE-like cation transporter